MKRKDLLLLLASTFVSLLVVEVCLRLFTAFPIEGPLANRIPDDRLGYRMDPALPDIDADGFRNAGRPAHTDPDRIVIEVLPDGTVRPINR